MILRLYNTSATVRFTLRQADSNAFATNSHWTPASGDVRIGKDGGTLANSTNLPTYANGQWSLTLTAVEMQAAEICVIIDDSAVVPESIYIETFGHVSARYATPYDLAYFGIDGKINADHGVGSYVGLDAAGTRAALGMAAADLDTQLGDLETAIGDIEAGGLTPGQAAQLDNIAQHTDLIVAGTPIVVLSVVNGGKIELYSGYDYTTDTKPILVESDQLPTEGTDLVMIISGDVYGSPDLFTLSGSVSSGAAVIDAERDSLPPVGCYTWTMHHVVNGNLHELDLAGTLIVRRGK